MFNFSGPVTINIDQTASINFLEKIMTSQAQLAERLTAITAMVAKIGKETNSLQGKISDLTTALANNSADVSPEVQAAVDALAAQVARVDALVPDLEEAPAEPEPEPEGPADAPAEPEQEPETEVEAPAEQPPTADDAPVAADESPAL